LIILDASLVLPLMIDESGTQAARAAYLAADTLAAPELLYIECANALRTRVKRGLTSQALAEAALDGVLGLPIRLVPSGTVMPKALKLGIELDHAVYDCLYLATALSLNGQVATMDKKFASKARLCGYSESVTLIEPSS
jgi:predicted nucleic acid-binding protein